MNWCRAGLLVVDGVWCNRARIDFKSCDHQFCFYMEV